ncbi:hypothetical protein GVX86_06585 [[Haemophilus] felis]|nr:hypothetical protein [[Haemophilus] felis]
MSGVIASSLLLSNIAFATLPKNVSADETLASATYNETLNGPFFNIDSGATATLDGDTTFNITANGDNETRVDITNGNLNTNHKLSINITPDASVKHTRPKGMIVRGDSTVNIRDLAVNVTLASEEDEDHGTPDSNASYGIALGYNHSGGAADKFSKLTVNNADINVTNTANTVFGNKTKSKFIATAKVKFGHQLSGLKIIRTNGSTPEFVSNGTLNINVHDSSTAKAGDYLVGVYISGNGAKATFNGDTNIAVSANGINSAGIKIGKPFEDSENGVSVTANGKLIVDTTATADSAAVRLFKNNAKLEVTGKNTQEKSEIKSGNSAIVYDTQDWKTSADVTIFGTFTIYTSRNFNGNNQSVKLNNTELSTTSETASLIKVNAENVRDQSFGQASRFSNQLNHGKFSVKNATFELSGDKSRATAAHNGWLMEVKGLDNTEPSDENKSDLTATISDEAKIIGLVHKEHSSKLDLTLNNATWALKKKGTQTTSTLNNLTLKNNAALDATLPKIAQADLEQAFNSAKQKGL